MLLSLAYFLFKEVDIDEILISDILAIRKIDFPNKGSQMTDFFHYDEMTWDAVEELPRDTPLVLPLGSGYDFALLAQQLSEPHRIGLLPAFPFGWRGSGLEIPETIFLPYISNLLDSLRDDGF